MIFIGIDLAWTNKNETGICVMDDSGRVLRHEAAVFSDDDLVEIILGYEGERCVGIDGPIVVNNDTGSRAAEGLMMQDQIHGQRLRAFNTNRQFLEKSYGVIRGERIFDQLSLSYPDVAHGHVHSKAEIKLLEVFPTGICLGLFPSLYPMKYKVKAKVKLEQAKLGMGRLLSAIDQLETDDIATGASGALYCDLSPLKARGYKHLEDMADAFLCAFGMYAIYTGRAEQRLYGSIEDGLITMPVLTMS